MKLAVGLVGDLGGVGSRLVAAGLEVMARGDLPGDPTVPAGARRLEGERSFFEELEFPRRIVLDLPTGAIVDEVLETIYPWLEPGDVVVDFTGSYWADTLRRFRRMRHRSIYHVDAAWVDGHDAERLLVAGDAEGVSLAVPVLARLVPENLLIRAGHAATAHFAHALADAVTVTAMQARSELRQMLEALPLEQDVPAVLEALMPDRAPVSGRASWVLDDAIRLEAAIPHLAQAIMQERAEQLEQHQTPNTLPRVGPFQHPDEIL